MRSQQNSWGPQTNHLTSTRSSCAVEALPHTYFYIASEKRKRLVDRINVQEEAAGLSQNKWGQWVMVIKSPGPCQTVRLGFIGLWCVANTKNLSKGTLREVTLSPLWGCNKAWINEPIRHWNVTVSLHRTSPRAWWLVKPGMKWLKHRPVVGRTASDLFPLAKCVMMYCTHTDSSNCSKSWLAAPSSKI